jgi:hypothetical protein
MLMDAHARAANRILFGDAVWRRRISGFAMPVDALAGRCRQQGKVSIQHAGRVQHCSKPFAIQIANPL